MGVYYVKSAACQGVQFACGERIPHAVAANLLRNGKTGVPYHREREIVANIVRYNHLEFDYSMENSEGIDREEYLTIVKLTAILQIANALDRSHKQKCRDIKAVRKDDKLILTITTNEDITLERGLFGSRAEFFREVYSIEPVIRQKRIL